MTTKQRFLGALKGKSGITTTRVGTTYSGLSAHVMGWNVGVFLEAGAAPDFADAIEITMTQGIGSEHGKKLYLGCVIWDKKLQAPRWIHHAKRDRVEA